MLLLCGCGSLSPIDGQRVIAQNEVRGETSLTGWPKESDSSYQIIYNFDGTPDGANPDTTLLPVNGMLYGTTASGGQNNNGTAFAISAAGKERVLYSFKGTPDGSNPRAGLVYVDGRFYGTTTGGGTKGDGTVFEVTISGKERVLHSFENVPDGYYPLAPLIAVDGALYGTTFYGGSSACGGSSSGYPGCGTVFTVTRSGRERVLHRFKGGRDDGAGPWAPLLAIGGELYGTAVGGGEYDAGVVYKIGESGKDRIIHVFRG